jgi:hypothetical protein
MGICYVQDEESAHIGMVIKMIVQSTNQAMEKQGNNRQWQKNWLTLICIRKRQDYTGRQQQTAKTTQDYTRNGFHGKSESRLAIGIAIQVAARD